MYRCRIGEFWWHRGFVQKVYVRDCTLPKEYFPSPPLNVSIGPLTALTRLTTEPSQTLKPWLGICVCRILTCMRSRRIRTADLWERTRGKIRTCISTFLSGLPCMESEGEQVFSPGLKIVGTDG